MTQPNIRHSPSEIYDPKQRAVGAIVLILLMILLYALLKALLGISGGTEYALRAPLPDEIKTNVQPSDSTDINAQFKYPLINRFVFLDLNGKPMSSSAEAAAETMDDEDDEENTKENNTKKTEKGDKKWYVQVASGKDKDRAEKLANELTEKKLPAEVIKSGEWYRIQLKPQETEEDAKQQLKLLKKEKGLKGQIRKVE
jgi:cell division septation protein DedD